jgi:hypothetical protein
MTPPDHLQAIVNTAGFHFAMIEQGGKWERGWPGSGSGILRLTPETTFALRATACPQTG